MRNHINTWPVLRLGIVAALALVLFLPAYGRAASSGAKPHRGGTLIEAIGGDPPTVNPDVSTGVPDQMVGCMVYQSLVRMTRKFKPAPLLAKSWKITDKGKKYTFQLVHAKWQDGKPFTSADVKYTLLNVSAKYGSIFAAAASHIRNIQTPNAHTAVINLKQPFGPMLYSLACPQNSAILPKHIFQGTNPLTNPATLSHPVGTGPFKLTSWVHGDHITMTRNPHYWKRGEPYLNSIVLKDIPDETSRVLALQTGEVQYVNEYYFPVSSLAQFRHNKKFREKGVNPPSDDLIIFNDRHKPYSNRLVRQALFMAINRDYTLKHVFFNQGSVGKSSIDTRLRWAYDPKVNYEKMYPYNPKKARQLLNKAGYKMHGGSRFTVDLVFDSTRAGNIPLAQAIESFWKAVGVDTKLDGSQRAVELNQVYTDWNFDATLQVYSTDGDPALGISRAYVTSSIIKAPFVNASGYSNPTVDKLFKEGESATSPKQRAKYYYKVQKILARDVPTLVTRQEAQTDVASAKIQGYWRGLQNRDWWDEVWLSK